MDLKVDLWQFGIISDVTPQIDIMELEQSQTLETALELMSGTNARFSYSSLAYYSMIALRPHVPRLQSWSLIFCASGVASDILRFQGWASFKFPLIRPNENWRKVIARELLRLQKRNVTSWRNILETKTCQCRTSVHTSTAKILKFLFYWRHGGAWSRAWLPACDFLFTRPWYVTWSNASKRPLSLLPSLLLSYLMG